MSELILLQTYDGQELITPDVDTRLLTYGNFGAPPVDWITRKGYRQHGETEVDYLLRPRTVHLELWQAPGCSRQAFWDQRLRLHEYLRHNRGGPMRLVLVQPDGTERALYVRANPGAEFGPPSVENNSWSIDEQLELVAFDPIWFDLANAHTTYEVGIDTGNLILPMTFPIVFGITNYIEVSEAITYVGTWHSFPTLLVHGPYRSVNIVNVQTGISIGLSVSALAGETRVIDLTPGDQSVTDFFGDNKITDLSPSSNLVDFCIQPDPIVPGGVQTIKATFYQGVSGQTAFGVSYYDRYFAI